MYRLLTLLIIPFLAVIYACSSDAPAVKTVTPPVDANRMEVVPPPSEPTRYRTSVDELRLRDASGTTSRVIMKMPVGQLLTDLGESSEETFTATIAGERVTDVWRKVSLLPAAGGDPIVGWTFGGGLVEERITYELQSDGSYRRSITSLPGSELSSLFDVDLLNDFTYEGELHYRKSPTGVYLKDGPFILNGLLAAEGQAEIPEDLSVTYQGAFADGQLDGQLIRRLSGLENRSTATIFFQKGRCRWGEINGIGEGQSYAHREENMGSCTFRYLEEGI